MAQGYPTAPPSQSITTYDASAVFALFFQDAGLLQRMKQPHASGHHRHVFRRDLAILAGIAVAASAVGFFTPVFDVVFAGTQRLGLLEPFAGVLTVVVLTALVLLVLRRLRLQQHVDTAGAQQTAPPPETSPYRPLTAFPEHDPNPILEVDLDGTVHYANPATRTLFPDLDEAGLAHPILHDLPGLAANLDESETPYAAREVQVGAVIYEQQAARVPEQGRLRFFLHDITRRKLAQDALRKSEEKFEHAFRSAPMAISINRLADGRFIDVNDHFLHLLGFEDRSLVIGRTSLELDMWAIPGNRARILDLLKEDHHRAHQYEAQVYTTDDQVRDVIVSVVAMEVDGEACVLSALLDVTEHRDAEAGLQTLKAFYENTLRDLPIEVGVLDDEARFIYLNPEAIHDEEARLWMFGKTSVDYALANNLDPAPHRRRHEWLLDVIARKEMGRLEETIPTASGETQHMLRVAMPVLDDDGAVIYVVGYGIDMTERKAFERQLMQAKSAAEEMVRLKSAFVANMSHEVRTPLTAILGFAAVLGEELDGEHRELAEIIKQSGERLLETLDSVLDLARLEADAMDFDPRSLNLNDELEAAVRLFGPMAEKKHLALVLETPDQSVRAPLDRAYLHRILSNLLSNAIKFTEAGEVRLVLRPLGTEVHLVVRDTGIGIAKSFLPFLFEEFKQESTGLDRTHTGSGLGLAITRHLVERMHGHIEIESIKGEGTTVTVTFPIKRGAPAQPGLYQQLDLFADTETQIVES